MFGFDLANNIRGVTTMPTLIEFLRRAAEYVGLAPRRPVIVIHRLPPGFLR